MTQNRLLSTVDMMHVGRVTYGTLAEQVEAELKRMVLDGELAPGEPLNQVEIASRLGVSRTVVREAMRSLAAQGFLEFRSRRRALTAPLSRRRLEEMLALRQELEAVAVRWALPKLDADQLRHLWAVYERMVASEEAGDEWLRLDRLLHAMIYRATGNIVLVSTLEGLRDQITRYMKLAWPTWKRSRGRDARSEHFELLAALESGDVELAVAAARAHVQGTTRWLLREFDEQAVKRALWQVGPSMFVKESRRDAERTGTDEC